MYSVQIAVSDGTLTRISLSIEYFEKDDITLYRNLELIPLVLGTDWQWDGDTAINLLTDIPVPAGEYITVRRNTNIDRAFNIYDGGAAFSRDTLDENFRQMIYLAQEFTEGNGLTGLFFPLDMHGFKITNLGDGTSPKDAINKGQLDVVDARVTSLEQSITTDTISYPWYEKVTVSKDTFAPPFTFTKAVVYIDGIAQIPGYSYIVVSNQILLAEPVGPGTLFFARLGEAVGLDPDYATADQLGMLASDYQAADAALQGDINGKASKGVNSDITQLTGLDTPLSMAQGGTGSNNAGGARANLGAAASGSNADITALTGLTGGISGLTTGAAAPAGIVGQILETTGTGTTMTTAVDANIVSLALPAGEWDVMGVVRYIATGVLSGYVAGVTTDSAVYGAFQTQIRESLSYTSAATVIKQTPPQRLRLSAASTVYIKTQASFSSGAVTATGYIRAERVR